MAVLNRFVYLRVAVCESLHALFGCQLLVNGAVRHDRTYTSPLSKVQMTISSPRFTKWANRGIPSICSAVHNSNNSEDDRGLAGFPDQYDILPHRLSRVETFWFFPDGLLQQPGGWSDQMRWLQRYLLRWILDCLSFQPTGPMNFQMSGNFF